MCNCWCNNRVTFDYFVIQRPPFSSALEPHQRKRQNGFETFNLVCLLVKINEPWKTFILVMLTKAPYTLSVKLSYFTV